MLPSDGYVATDDGVRLYYQTLGHGPRIIVVPNGIYLFDDFKPLADGRTLVFYDVRNRGRSDKVADEVPLRKGILSDVEDLDAIRRHFKLETTDLIGHSYIGLMVALYAMQHPEHTGRVVQVGPMGPSPDKQHPPEWSGADEAQREVFAKLAKLQQEPRPADPAEACRRFWSVLRFLYVTDPANAHRVEHWGRCELANERGTLKYLTETIMPSIRRLDLGDDDFAKAKAPILIIHGTKDRSAPFGGGLDWAERLPNARLVAVPDGGHAPWIENPALVFGAIRAFLGGGWPDSAEKLAPGSR